MGGYPCWRALRPGPPTTVPDESRPWLAQACRARRSPPGENADAAAAAAASKTSLGRRRRGSRARSRERPGPAAADALRLRPSRRRLAEHIGGDAALAQLLAFDAFLPTLVRGGQEAKALEAKAEEAGKPSTQPSSSSSSLSSSSSGGGGEFSRKPGTREGEGAGTAPWEPRISPDGRGGPWQPPFMRRWPRVFSVSPSSVRIQAPEVPPLVPPLSEHPVNGADGDGDGNGDGARGSRGEGFVVGGRRVASAKRGQGSGEEAEECRAGSEGAGHRVLIAGRNFAHPCATGTPAGDAPWFCGKPHEEGAAAVGGVRARDGAGRRRPLRPVFVIFGRDVVPGRVLSDALIEAHAPASPEAGFVDVVVVVGGEGPGGDLASDSVMARADSRASG